MIEHFEDIQPKKLVFNAILPCAGFGTRVNMPADKSKELLVDPTTKKPLIQWHIDLCKEYNIEPIFIIRPEKTDLIEYVKDIGTTVLYTPKENEEWMFSIFNNKEHFGVKNILMLPDTTFEPKEIMKEMKEQLEWLELVSLTHEVTTPNLWGCITDSHIYEKQDWGNNTAWGVLGFDISIVHIFEDLGKYKQTDISRFVKHQLSLTNFKDHTRNGKIE